MELNEAIRRVVDRTDLTESQMVSVMERIMTGQATDAQIGAFLTGLRMKGETIDEIVGAARVMREKATKIDPGDGPLVDTCGTGGDGADTFNISTTAAFVVAGAGVKVAKHGNRAVSSKSGSADVLVALGVKLDAPVEKVEGALRDVGICFLFAPAHHGAMKHAIGPRREMGIRTIFNVLGPLTNPAGAKAQLIGVFARELVVPLADALGRLGSERVYVVHGADGLDEITVTGPTHLAYWDGTKVIESTIAPDLFGFPTHSAVSLKGGDAAVNAAITKAVLAGEKGAHRDIVLLNAGFALAAAGAAATPDDGVRMAAAAVDTGAAAARLSALVSFMAS
ncbi:MAG: anthranilate phosphoribosyltransferase [Nitrospinae bacterium]|nr:anthranilate phosphoribosyltransferase [Nitrospinota bacterium]